MSARSIRVRTNSTVAPTPRISHSKEPTARRCCRRALAWLAAGPLIARGGHPSPAARWRPSPAQRRRRDRSREGRAIARGVRPRAEASLVSTRRIHSVTAARADVASRHPQRVAHARRPLMDDSQPTGERSQVPVHVHDGSDSSSAPSHASTAGSSRASTVACLDASAAQRSRAPAWPANVPPTQLAFLPALPDLDVEGATAVRRDIPVLDFLIVGETVTSFVARGILWPPHCEYAGMRTLGLLATLPSRSRRRSRVTVAHVYQLLNRRSAKSVPCRITACDPKAAVRRLKFRSRY
jgi:hypothetical protein